MSNQHKLTIHARLQLNQDKSKCRALGPMYGKIRHKTMMIPGKTEIFQRDPRIDPPRFGRFLKESESGPKIGRISNPNYHINVFLQADILLE